MGAALSRNGKRLTGHACAKKVDVIGDSGVVEITDVGLVDRPISGVLVAKPFVFTDCLAGEVVTFNHGDMTEARFRDSQREPTSSCKQLQCVQAAPSRNRRNRLISKAGFSVSHSHKTRVFQPLLVSFVRAARSRATF